MTKHTLRLIVLKVTNSMYILIAMIAILSVVMVIVVRAAPNMPE